MGRIISVKGFEEEDKLSFEEERREFVKRISSYMVSMIMAISIF